MDAETKRVLCSIVRFFQDVEFVLQESDKGYTIEEQLATLKARLSELAKDAESLGFDLAVIYSEHLGGGSIFEDAYQEAPNQP